MIESLSVADAETGKSNTIGEMVLSFLLSIVSDAVF